MTQTILITGATDGIGLRTAHRLAGLGHTVLLHGRNADKLERAASDIAASTPGPIPPVYRADLTSMAEIAAMARAIIHAHPRLDVVIHNAGVFKLAQPQTADGLDARFVVNTLAPALLTQQLLPNMAADGRILTLSSAAQAPPDLDALTTGKPIDDFAAYAQSKLALTMWSAWLAEELGPDGPSVIAVNPGSLLDTKMVREGFGRSRGTADVGAEILERLALTDLGADASGRYFDNDAGAFAAPHPDAADADARAAVASAIRATLARISG